MKQVIFSSVAALVLLIAMALGCAPKAAPVPTPAPAALIPAPESAPKTAISPEEAAWAQVVEAAKKEGKLVIYSYAFVGDVAIALQRAFNSRYGISADIVSGSGPGLHERLRAERRSGRMVADVVEGSVTNKVNMKLDELTRPYGELPALQEKGGWIIDPRIDAEGHILYYSPQILAPWVNTRLVKPEEAPRSWKELANPKWRGKIIAIDPATIQVTDQFYVVMKGRGLLPEEYFVALGKQELKRAYPAQRGPELLAKGEGHVLLMTTDSTGATFVAQGAPIRPVDVEEGVAAFSLAFSLIRDSPHAQAGRLFAHWLLAREGTEVYAKARGVLPIRKDVPDFRPEGVKLEYKKLIVYTIQELDEGAKAFQERRVNRLWSPQAK